MLLTTRVSPRSSAESSADSGVLKSSPEVTSKKESASKKDLQTPTSSSSSPVSQVTYIKNRSRLNQQQQRGTGVNKRQVNRT